MLFHFGPTWPEVDRKEDRLKQRILSFLLLPLLFAAAALCGFFFFREYHAAQREIAEYTEIQDSYTSGQSVPCTVPESSEAIPATPGLSVDFSALLAVNRDTVGWLSIPGTGISYPVVQANDNDTYLHTSFYGKRSGAGAVFMDCKNSADPLDRNTIIYGHNMGRGRTDMFGSLLRYNDEKYYGAHRWIQFDTVHGQYGWWRVFAVLHLDAQATEFDYLRQDFRDGEEFKEWIAQARALSLYPADMPVPEGANILTLSTCNRARYGEHGRQVVLAVKVA